FRAMGNQLSYGDFLDNVTVEGGQRIDENVVPEPSSVALITAGLMMVGVAARRRRVQKAA
ncbi:MAG: PEP-CTERM sorting domain-containing protein, partial [Gemmatimonadaceae bacterium]